MDGKRAGEFSFRGGEHVTTTICYGPDHPASSGSGRASFPGKTVAEVCRKIGITDQTYYRWRKRYGGLKTDHAKRLRELEKENTRLKRLVADQALDISILKEVSRPNF